MASVQVARRRFSVGEYHRMAEAGILGENDRLELVGGEIVEMSPIGSRHVACVGRLNQLLVTRVGGSVIVFVQSPVLLGEHEEPEPDLAVVRFREDYYARELPGPSDVLILIEVADTSLAYDRGVKLPMYARAGIPETWLADLPGDAIERHTEPAEDGYGLVRRVRRGELLESVVLPELVIRVDDVLGGR